MQALKRAEKERIDAENFLGKKRDEYESALDVLKVHREKYDEVEMGRNISTELAANKSLLNDQVRFNF